jgi:hypothetical protein
VSGAASATPAPCSSFDGTLEAQAEPIVLANQPRYAFDLPAGAGVLLPAHQLVRIEAHYLNASSEMLTPGATVTIRGTPAAQAGAYQPAGFGVFATKQISIPPKSGAQTPVLYQAGIAGSTIFAVTAYEHALGNDVTVWSARSATDTTSPPLLDQTTWYNPTLAALVPPLAEDGANGIAFRCTWLNTTMSAVGFGEDPASEMCLVGVYYYPSHGPDVCIDGACQNR